MSTWFENVITFSDDVLRRRDHSRSTRQSELRRFYTFIGRNNAKTKQKSNVWGFAPNPTQIGVGRATVELSPAGPPEADHRIFFTIPCARVAARCPGF